MDRCNRHIHIVVVFLTVGKTAAKQFGLIATDTLHCPSSRPTLHRPNKTLSFLGSLCNLAFVVFTFFLLQIANKLTHLFWLTFIDTWPGNQAGTVLTIRPPAQTACVFSSTREN